jgi:hypothetical protein
MKGRTRAWSWAAAALLAGIVLGSGAAWLWQSRGEERARAEREKVMNMLVIRRNLDRTYDAMLQLGGQYIRASNAWERAHRKADGMEMALLGAQLTVQKLNYGSQEKLLASLEGRAPRTVPLTFVTPPEIEAMCGGSCSVPVEEKGGGSCALPRAGTGGARAEGR